MAATSRSIRKSRNISVAGAHPFPAGAEAFKRDVPDAEVHLYDTGHFALETHLHEIAGAIRDFLRRKVK